MFLKNNDGDAMEADMSWKTLPQRAGGRGLAGKRPASSCLHGPCCLHCAFSPMAPFSRQERKGHSIPMRGLTPPKILRTLNTPLSPPAVLIADETVHPPCWGTGSKMAAWVFIQFCSTLFTHYSEINIKYLSSLGKSS